MMWGYGMDMGWMWLWGALTLVGISFLVFFMIRMLGDGGYGTERRRGPDVQAERRSRARQILDERFARGELTAEEYRERLTVLGEGP
ncbi:SHOCT domain-containing protein [Arthrobacter silvisoli]|uniref:SHOCT domain-containing protein n=1 Tax=Arthrobacter silvisoli TaxID=2291022 RepID=UPI000E210056|nr:SHOCT domain-containing protein [Arthrobacter silvisoli]